MVRMRNLTDREKRVIRPLPHRGQFQPGFTREDFRAMALTSRALLAAGQLDVAAEIHELLCHCCIPLRDWCGPATPEGYEEAVLIDADLLVPTEDCVALAAGHSTVPAAIEEEIFAAFMAAIADDKGFRSDDRNRIYSAVREMVVRRPVITAEEITVKLRELGAQSLIGVLSNQIYQPIDPTDTQTGEITLCGNCGSKLRRSRSTSWQCPIRECRMKNPHRAGLKLKWQPGLMEVAQALQRYWVGPGLDELEIYDAAIAASMQGVELYPNCDACDVFLPPDIGIDVKCRQVPKLLAHSLNQNIGGLKLYKHKVVAISDHLLKANPKYLEQLEADIDKSLGVKVYRVSQVKKVLIP